MKRALALSAGLALSLVFLLALAALAEVKVRDRGTFEHTWYFQFGKGRLIDIQTGTTEYNIALQTFKEDLNVPPEKTRYRIGLFRDEVDRGWYGYRFINLFLDGKSILDHPPKVTAVKGGKQKGLVAVTWDTDDAVVTMEFSCLENGDCVFLEIKLEPKRELKKIRTYLVCYPGDYAQDKPESRERWISTAKRDIRYQAEKIILDKKEEPWVFYYDKKIDPAKTGKKHHASCALLYAPEEPDKVEIQVSNYSVQTNLYYPPKTRSIHCVLWKFPGEANAKALEYMRKLKVEK